MAPAQITLGDGRALPITAALERELAAAEITSATHAAQIVDGELSPALLLIAGGELAYVTRNRTQRWRPAELKRVEGKDIIPLAGPAVTIGDWGATSERADFLRAAAALIKAHETAEPAAQALTDAHAATTPAPAGSGRRVAALALISGCLSAIIGGLGLASTSAFTFNVPHHTELLESFLVAGAVLGGPLLLAGVKLARRDSPWRGLGVFGAAVGGIATVTLLPAIVALAHFSPNWPS